MMTNEEVITARAEEFVARAKAAYHASGAVTSPSVSRIMGWGTKVYVVLQFHTNTLAVFRIENCGRLKRLKRWPCMVASPVEPVARRVPEVLVYAREFARQFVPTGA